MRKACDSNWSVKILLEPLDMFLNENLSLSQEIDVPVLTFQFAHCLPCCLSNNS